MIDFNIWSAIFSASASLHRTDTRQKRWQSASPEERSILVRIWDEDEKLAQAHSRALEVARAGAPVVKVKMFI